MALFWGCGDLRFARHVPAALSSARVLRKLLEGGHSKIARRLGGAFRNSGCDAVADEIMKTMSAAGCIVRETDPAMRVVLGHFVFVYIHPFMDGNGRMGRFLMNLMMAGGGYPCTVIPVSDRQAYTEAMEKPSVGEDIGPFTDLLTGIAEKRLAGEPLPAVPRSSP